MWNNMDELIGKIILDIYLDVDNLVKFETNQGDLVYYLDSDCCSESFFSEISGLKSLTRGYPVASVVENRSNSNGTRQGYDTIHNFMFTFTGSSEIAYLIFINSSNGYYDGWIDLTTSTKEQKWVKLTKDYYLKEDN